MKSTSYFRFFHCFIPSLPLLSNISPRYQKPVGEKHPKELHGHHLISCSLSDHALTEGSPKIRMGGRDHTSLRTVSFFRCPNKQHCHLQASSPDSPYTLQLVTKSTIHWLLRCSLSQALLITGNVCSPPQVAPRQSRVLATHWTTWNPQSKADSRIEAASPLPPLLQFCRLTMMIRAPPCHSV